MIYTHVSNTGPSGTKSPLDVLDKVNFNVCLKKTNRQETQDDVPLISRDVALQGDPTLRYQPETFYPAGPDVFERRQNTTEAGYSRFLLK